MSKPKLLHVGKCVEGISDFNDKVFTFLEGGGPTERAKSNCCNADVTLSRSEDYSYIVDASGETIYKTRSYEDGFWNDEYYCWECGDECKIK